MNFSVSGLKDDLTFLFCLFVCFPLRLTTQEPTKDDRLFLVKTFLYLSLGVLGGLLLIGTAWEIFIRKKAKTKQDVVLGERWGQTRNL